MSLEKCIGWARPELVELLGKQKATSRAQVGSGRSAVVAEACSEIQVSAGTGGLWATQVLWRKWQISVDTLTIGRLCASYRALGSVSRGLQKGFARPRLRVAGGSHSGPGAGVGSPGCPHTLPMPEAEGAPLPPAVALQGLL